MSWLNAPQTGKGDSYIHPTGGTAEYETSGKPSAEYVMSYLKKRDKVLEYGCGNGRILRHITNKCAGVDIVPEFVQQAKDLGLDVHLVSEYKAEPIFNAVYSITVFIHLSKADGLAALEYIYNSLKPGGLALLQIPIYEIENDPNSWIDVGTWSKERLHQAADYLGFEIVELHTNPGAFSYHQIGANHEKLQILKKQ